MAMKPNLVSIVWPMASKFIEMALEHSHGEIDIDKMKQQLIDGELIMLVVHDDDEPIAAVVMDKRQLQCGKDILFIVTVGGTDVDKWGDELIPLLDVIAIEHGCEAIYGAGRPGWQRLMKNQGYELAYTVMYKKVGEKL